MDWESAAFSIRNLNLENPFKDQEYKFYLLIEVSGEESEEIINDKIINLFEKLDGLYEDGIICENET